MADEALRGDLANSTDPTKGAALVGYMSRTQFDKNQERVTPEDFGAGRPGVTDNQAWNSMLSALHSTLSHVNQIEAKGTYYFTAPLTQQITRNNLTLDGCGSGIIDCSGMDQTATSYLFTATSPRLTGAKTQLTSSLVETHSRAGHILTVADSSQFQVGDGLLVTSLGHYFGGIVDKSGYTPRNRGFINKVKSIPSATQIAMEWSPIMAIDLAEGAVNVWGCRFNKGLKITNFAEIRSGTDEIRIDSGPTSACLLNAEYYEDVEISNIGRFYNWGGSAIRTQFGIKHRLSNVDFRQVHQAWNLFGIEGFTSENNRFYGGRRCYNTDASGIRQIDPDSQEVVHSNNFLSLGGSTYFAFTGPGGHLCLSQRIIGHKTRNVTNGINSRGKRLTVIGCDLEASNGIGVGYDNSNVSDPSYDEEPNVEWVMIDNTTRIRAASVGILISSSVDSGDIQAQITADAAGIRSWAKYLNNLKISSYIEGNSAADSKAVWISAAIEIHNIQIVNSTFKNVESAVLMEGVSTSADHIRIDSCLFDNVALDFVRMNGAAFDTRTCGVLNCKRTVDPSGNYLAGFRASGHPTPHEYNNDWPPLRRLYVVNSGSIDLEDPIPQFTLFINNGTSDVTLSTINNGYSGRQITLVRSGTSGSVTIAAGGNIYLAGGSCTLSSNEHSITLVCRSGTIWSEVGRYVG